MYQLNDNNMTLVLSQVENIFIGHQAPLVTLLIVA